MWKRKFSAAGGDASAESSASRGRGAGGSGSGSSGFGFVRSGGSEYTPPVNPAGSYGGFGGGGSYAGYRGGSGRRSLPDDEDDDIADIEYRDDGDGGATTATGFGEGEDDEGNRRAAAAEEEEEDPLDAFMSGIEQKVKEDAVAATSRAAAAAAGAKGGESGEAAKPEREDWRAEEEEADLLDSFLRARKSAGLSVAAEAVMGRGYDSDEEVYAAAKAVDAAAAAAAAAGAAGGAAGSALEYDSDDNPIVADSVTSLKSKMDALGHVDHSAIEYDEFEKDFYQEHPDVTAMSAADVAARLAALSIRTSGFDVPRPISAFAHAALPPALMGAVRKHGYSAPTPIQSAALPVILSGRDVIGVAKTGSGKTAAFVLPLIVHAADQPRAGRGEGPIALICAPTRELAAQIHAEARRFAKPLNLRVAGVFGGMSKFEQFKELKGGVEVVVATPGRLIDMLKMKALSLRRCTFLVLDEADMMFHLGFEPQVRAIVGQIRPDRQTLLFSATMPRRIERLARDILTHPVRIAVGEVGAANTDVRQQVVVLPGDDAKVPWLLGELGTRVDEGDVLVFAGTKAKVDVVTAAVAAAGFKVGALHGDLDQSRRSEVVRQLKKGELHVVVATDVAARGLDIRSIKTVINLDSARDMDAHVHRVGRTGRAGDTDGVAISVVTGKEARFAGELVGCLVAGGQEVPAELLELAMKLVTQSTSSLPSLLTVLSLYTVPPLFPLGPPPLPLTIHSGATGGSSGGSRVGTRAGAVDALRVGMMAKFKSSFVAASAPHPHDPVPDLPLPPPPPPPAPAASLPAPPPPAAAALAAPQAAVAAPAWGASGGGGVAAAAGGSSMGADVVAAAIAAAAAKAAAIAASLGLQAPGGVGGAAGLGGAAAGGMAMGGGATGPVAGLGAAAGGVDGVGEVGDRERHNRIMGMSGCESRESAAGGSDAELREVLG
ncbi:unnamed protein product [Closterium sp. Naga37s-1]|nr:unnamed protein product [Closterium sp. Naga37s-1]